MAEGWRPHQKIFFSNGENKIVRLANPLPYPLLPDRDVSPNVWLNQCSATPSCKLIYLIIRISVLIDFFFRFPHGTMIGMYFMMKEFAHQRFRVVSPIFTNGAVVANRPHDSFMDTGFFLRHRFCSSPNELVPGSIDIIVLAQMIPRRCRQATAVSHLKSIPHFSPCY